MKTNHNKNDVYKTLYPQQMLVHKGGQINNVQLITGLRIAEMSQLQNCSVMCTKNGSYYIPRKLFHSNCIGENIQ